ncbi:uncharacterized protein A1O9_06006 [Exophiala aquamarina CBS 119918]|uniref:Store-operated calcium entry-associated regulatory factor n=1 Tax=Exophiala aquamarina CBS 119918 TaxID=1182545 RepID=A0A072PFM6_9EURO|nr:uncharacterized protein A1O9_06006 [Exophiala aquamarina CBS 119918]KEF58083.1 hypothetical protein A1O9_06006 [Exophiala aquamarina CBS 119918]
MVRLVPDKLALCLLTFLLTEIALTAKVTNPKKVPKNAVLLSKVSALTVRSGKQTASRRVKPVPQLQCVGPANICKLYAIDVMRCTNEGADYDENNVQWSCKASLPEEFKLGATDVSCEGYLSSEDPYVLSGSCGVEYRLLLTDKGEARYGSQSSWGSRKYGDGNSNAVETYAGYLFMALFLGVLFIILRGIYKAWRDEARRRPTTRPRGGGGGFGGGGDDDPPNDPPPPYSARPKKATWSSGSRSGTFSTTRTQQEGWRPGFWTGTAAGAAAGYLAGRGNQTRTEQQPPRRGTGSNWFGGGGGYAGPSTPRSSGSGSSSSSGARHESTGFGGTSRR